MDPARQHQVEEVVKAVERAAPDAPHEQVEARAAEEVERLADAPIQAFTPLLAQNRVTRELKHGGSGAPDADVTNADVSNT